MKRIECNPTPDCKFWDNEKHPCPFMDTHHVYPERTADTRLKRIFGNLKINKIVACRWIHEDVLDNIPPPEYPEPREMRRIIDGQR